MRVFRVLRLAVRLLVGEFRRNPMSVFDIARRGLLGIFGRSKLEHNGNSAVVESVLQAESEATGQRTPTLPTSAETGAGRMRGPAGLARRVRRTFGDSFFSQFGLGLLRQGHVADAAWLLRTTADRHPEHVRVAAAATVVEGERRVLGGDWAAPAVTPRRVDPRSATVLHVVGKSLPHTIAGYTIRTQSIVTAQRAAGLAPQVVSRIGFPWYVGSVPAAGIEQVDDVSYHRIGGPEVPPRWDDRLDANVDALMPVVEEVRPAVLHAHSDFENALLALALRDRFDIPVVYEVRGFWEETWLSGSPERRPEADRYRWRHEREVACAAAAERVVTLASTMERRLVGDGVERSKITVIPNAVDPERFPRIGRDRRLAAQLGVQPDDVVVGYISSLVDYEGVDTLLEAAATMVEAGDPIRVLIVGDGNARPRLEKLAGKLRLGRRVQFTGRVSPDEVLRYYGMIDVFVVPRRNDRVCRLVTPLKPFEAMSTGTALVMSGVEALRDIAEESQAAATFRPEDAEDLVATLRPLVNDPDARSRLGAFGYEWVREERTWARNAARYVELYRDLDVL